MVDEQVAAPRSPRTARRGRWWRPAAAASPASTARTFRSGRSRSAICATSARSSMPVDRRRPGPPTRPGRRGAARSIAAAWRCWRPRAARPRRSGAAAAPARTASSRSSASSETSKSASRVTRKTARSRISMPGKSHDRKCASTSSSGSSSPRAPTGRKRGSPSGTFTRAKRSSPVSGSRTNTPRLIERAEMYGNGWPGPTASGVSTGKISLVEAAGRARPARPRCSHRRCPTRMPSFGERRGELLVPEPRLLRRRVRRRARWIVGERLLRRAAVGGADGDAGGRLAAAARPPAP